MLMFVSIAWLYPGGYSAADWNVVGLTGGGVQVTVSAADNSGAGSIPTAALSMGILSGAVVAAAGAAGTMTEELASLTITQQTLEQDRLGTPPLVLI